MLNLFKSNSLTVEVLQTKFFVHPSSSKTQPGTDALIHGSLVLDLKKPSQVGPLASIRGHLVQSEQVNSLTVTLQGLYDISYADPRQFQAPMQHASGQTLERTLTLASQDVEMAAGQSIFAFTMAIPSNTACQQRCSYGRIRHKLVAEANIGGTKLRGEKMIQLTGQPTADASPPLPLALEVQDVLPELGPFAARFSASFFTVGSPLLTEFSLPSLPNDVDILRVTLNVLQKWELEIGESWVKPPVQPWRSFLVDAHHPASLKMPASTPFTTMARKPLEEKEQPMSSLKAGESYRFEHLARVPSDDHVRPSTLAGCETPIRVSHQLELDIAFRLPGEPIKNLRVTREVAIASCCCLLAAISLPQYSEKPTVVDGPLYECICGATLKDLIDSDGKSLPGTFGDEPTRPAPCSYKLVNS